MQNTGLNARLMVGMEIHVELATRSKMWTGAANVAHADHFDAAPNTLLDPVVIGMPGTLPVMNAEALDMAMLVGLALNCEIARFSKWDRKSYYYPDLPKNYQLSQYDQPICGEGWMDIEIPHKAATAGRADTPAEPRTSADSQPGGSPVIAGGRTKRIRIIRAHLEEDAGKLLHEAPGGHAIEGSIVDLNRAGTPLLEIVTYPDFETAEEAVAFSVALRDLCRALNVTEGIMQKGHIRFEPNINVIIEKDGVTYKTPIAEIKNLNSFKAVEGAINHEYERQIDEWLRTGRVMKPGTKSTRGWNDATGTTFLQREKEEADDYRYFPDPDLTPVVVTEEWIERLRTKLPELPAAKEKRYVEVLGLSAMDAQQLLAEPETALLFDGVVQSLASIARQRGVATEPVRACKLLLNVGAKVANEKGCAIHELTITQGQIATILDMATDRMISAAGADKLFALCCEEEWHSASPEVLASTFKLLQVSDSSALEGFVAAVLADAKNAKAVADIKAGKDKAIASLMGQVMKLSKGQANAQVVSELIKAKING